MEAVVPKSLYPCGCVILSVQKYLSDFHVRIADEGQNLRVLMNPKDDRVEPPALSDYLNHLQHAAFRYQRERDTAELRRLLLEKAFSLYK